MIYLGTDRRFTPLNTTAVCATPAGNYLLLLEQSRKVEKRNNAIRKIHQSSSEFQ